MNNKIDTRTRRTINSFMQQYDIRKIVLEKDIGIDIKTTICNTSLFLKNNNQQDDITVVFKLHGEAANVHEVIKRIERNGEINVTLNPLGKTLAEAELNQQLLTFINIIEKRTAQIDKEEKIQHIAFEGNSFIINKTIKINVVNDDGNGNLDIELIKGKNRQDAKMRANDLMDGLYLGSIKEC